MSSNSYATFPGPESVSTYPALGFTLSVVFFFPCAATFYTGNFLTLALLFLSYFRAPYNVKQKSVDLDEEDVPFSPDEHKKRYAFQVTTFFLQGAVTSGLTSD